MTRFKLVNGERIQLTAQEEAQRDQEQADWEAGAFNRALGDLREKRNNLLQKTDWMANSDVTMSDDWKTYRQQLRDITNGLNTVAKIETKLKLEDGELINFPVKPS